MALNALRQLRPSLQDGVTAARGWFRRMVQGSRFCYEFRPRQRSHTKDSSPVRDMGTAADLAVLQAQMGGTEFDEAINATLEHYTALLMRETTYEQEGPLTAEGLGGRATEVERSGPEPWCCLDPQGIGEPSSIAHSAMLLLGLAAHERYPGEAAKERLLAELANGLLHQQRRSGAFKIYFSPSELRDSGWELYGGEAALALAAAYQRLGEERYVRAARHALKHYAHRFREGAVDAEHLVFFANWQCQAGRAVHRHTTSPHEGQELAAYLAELQDSIIKEKHFYDALRQAPESAATVEVACALEGLADALAVELGSSTTNNKRLQLYSTAAQSAVAFLQEAQVKPGEGNPEAAVGGFGHTQSPSSTQRIDVTGHVCSAYLKLLALCGDEE